MATYDFQYRLNSSPEPRNDGSGMVAHDIDAVASVQGADEWFTIPARHKTILVPGADLLIVMAMPNNGAKITAYKDLLAANLNTQAVPIVGWDVVSLQAMLDANDQSSEAATEANDYITITLGQTYPVQFAF